MAFGITYEDAVKQAKLVRIVFQGAALLAAVLLLIYALFIYPGGTQAIKDRMLCVEQAPVLAAIQNGSECVAQCSVVAEERNGIAPNFSSWNTTFVPTSGG